MSCPAASLTVMKNSTRVFFPLSPFPKTLSFVPLSQVNFKDATLYPALRTKNKRKEMSKRGGGGEARRTASPWVQKLQMSRVSRSGVTAEERWSWRRWSRDVSVGISEWTLWGSRCLCLVPPSCAPSDSPLLLLPPSLTVASFPSSPPLSSPPVRAHATP